MKTHSNETFPSREKCLTVGFPYVVMFIIALLAAMRIGAQFGGSAVAEIGTFLIVFLLQFLVY